jgi:hypothetical protein
MRGLLNRIIKAGVDEDVILRPLARFTRDKITQVAERAAIEFRNRSMNLISCYGPLEGEFGVYSALSNFVQTKNPLTAEINEAVQGGDEVELLEVLIQTMEVAFVSLVEKNALKRLQLVDTWPPDAMAEFARMRQSVVATKPVHEAPVGSTAPAAPVVLETPVETCSREFRELPSSTWKKKWLLDQRNRPATDQAAAEGRI